MFSFIELTGDVYNDVLILLVSWLELLDSTFGNSPYDHQLAAWSPLTIVESAMPPILRTDVSFEVQKGLRWLRVPQPSQLPRELRLRDPEARSAYVIATIPTQHREFLQAFSFKHVLLGRRLICLE